MKVFTLLHGRWLPWALLYAVFFTNLALDVWLLRVLRKQRAEKQLPLFFSYIAWELISTVVGIATSLVSKQLYVTVYWWKEPVKIILLIAAVWESLLKIFKDFKPLLRWSVLAVLTVVLVYSTWRSIHAPPVLTGRIVAFILGAEFTLRWSIAGATVVATGLMWFIQEPAGGPEDAVITGAAMASMGFVIWVVVLWLFGIRANFFAQYLPDMGYFVAVSYWIRMFSRPQREFGFKELGMGPEEIRKELHDYGEILDEMRKDLS